MSNSFLSIGKVLLIKGGIVGALADQILTVYSIGEKLTAEKATLNGLTFHYEDGQVYDSVQKELPTYLDAFSEESWEDFAARIVAVESPVDIMLTDLDGNRVGSLYEDGVFVEEVNEIEGAIYSGAGSDPELIVTPYSEDDFTISFHGTDSGEYTLTTLLIDGDTVKSNVQSGETSGGEVKDFDVEVLETSINLNQAEPGAFLLSIEVILGVVVVAIVAVVALLVFFKRKK